MSHLQKRNEFARFLNSTRLSIRRRERNTARRVCAIADSVARTSTSKSVQRYQEVTRFPRSQLSKMHLHCDSHPHRCTLLHCIGAPRVTIPFVVVSKGEMSVTARASVQDIELIKNCNYQADSEAYIISAVM